MNKYISRGILILAFIASIGVIAYSISVSGLRAKESWAVIAAALAVITSVISSWSTQRIVELHEAAKKPYPIPSWDTSSRYGLVQLCVTNIGGGVASDIYIEWEKPLLNSKGENIPGLPDDTPDIPALFPGEKTFFYVDGVIQFIDKYKNDKMEFNGTIKFKDASGEVYRHPFFLKGEYFRKRLMHTNEELRTHYDIQKIPGELIKISKAIKDLNKPDKEP